jgi:hypothetical protein
MNFRDAENAGKYLNSCTTGALSEGGPVREVSTGYLWHFRPTGLLAYIAFTFSFEQEFTIYEITFGSFRQLFRGPVPL